MSEGAPGETDEFVRSLAREDRVLVDVRDQLYGGAWEELERDLRARLAGRPYIFKLATKIEEDLARIGRLRAFEAVRRVNLGEILERLAAEGPGPLDAGAREAPLD